MQDLMQWNKNWSKNWIRKDLKDFQPYHAAVPPHDIKLDNNESPFPLSARVKQSFLRWIDEQENLNVYPDSDATELRNALALFWNAGSENFLCGVGSDQIIDYITKVFIEPGDTVVTLKPTFSMYRLSALLNHGRVKEIPLKDGFSCDIHDIIKTVNAENAKLLLLCSPNNPTGNNFTEKELIEILSAVDCPVVIDEAYAEFSNQTMIPYIDTYKNLIVLRTFSKAYGLAGARVGYAAACEAMIQAIGIVKAPYNLNTLSQLLAVWVLQDSAEYKQRIALLTAYKDDLYQKLTQVNRLKVYPSEANFLLIATELDLSAALQKEGIIVRSFNNDDIKGIRLSVGTPEQNTKVCGIIQNFMATDTL